MHSRESFMVDSYVDQADGLRRMVRLSHTRTIAVVGGTQGAGATTCAANLAAALAKQGVRAAVSGITRRVSDKGVDFVLLDAGSTLEASSAIAQIAHDVIVVVSPRSLSITGGYALVKSLSRSHDRCRFWVLVNRASGELTATRVHANIARVARQHLDVAIEHLGAIPEDPDVAASARRSLTVVDAAPMAAASRSFCEAGAAMLRSCVPQIDSSRLHNFMQPVIFGSRVMAAGAGV